MYDDVKGLKHTEMDRVGHREFCGVLAFLGGSDFGNLLPQEVEDLADTEINGFVGAVNHLDGAETEFIGFHCA